MQAVVQRGVVRMRGHAQDLSFESVTTVSPVAESVSG